MGTSWNIRKHHLCESDQALPQVARKVVESPPWRGESCLDMDLYNLLSMSLLEQEQDLMNCRDVVQPQHSRIL